MTSKREREYERRRLERWQERQARSRAQRHRRNVIVGSVVGGLAVVGAIVLAVTLSGNEPAAPVPTATATTTAPATPAPTPTPTSTIDTTARVGNGGVLPAASLAEGRTWTATLTTNRGDIAVELDGAAAPQAVANFVTLAQQGFFDQTKCHRLVPAPMSLLQCGDPTASGFGGPGYTWGPLENVPADNVYKAGDIAMARAQDDGSSMGSQFFLVVADSTIPSDKAGGYTVFGHVTSGLDVLKAIADAGTVTVGSVTAPVSDVIIEGVQTQ